MRHFMRRLPVKIVLFILCIVSLATAVGSGVGVAAMFDAKVYTRSKEDLLDEARHHLFYNKASSIVEHSLYEYNNLDTEYVPEKTNLRYQVWDPAEHVISRNTEEELLFQSYKWDFVYSFTFEFDEEGGYWLTDVVSDLITNTSDTYVICGYLEEGLPVTDDFSTLDTLFDFFYSMRYSIYPIGIAAVLLTLISFIILMCVAGRRAHTDEIVPGSLYKVPVDLLIFVSFIIWCCFFAIGCELLYSYDYIFVVFCVLFGILSVSTFIGLSMSIATRSKTKTLFSNTVIGRSFRLLRNFFKWSWKHITTLFSSIPLIWRTILIVGAVSFLELLVLMICWWETDILCVYWMIEKLIVIPLVLYGAIFLRKLQAGGEALAKGDLDHQVDTKIMFWDFKKHGENLNSIGEGMSVAVEKRLQSERMKTELITNVSHDIKTPLTSIINYADLIGKEPCNSEKHKEYAEVLVRKSEHLRRLLDDLVEVSKANTGNLEVELAPCDAGVLLSQAAGEYEQRLESANLELITTQPEKKIMIMADSRRIWRIFENLLGNACKYSLPGSRVYVTLEEIGRVATFTFRNTSASALNISADELMERFVRGDSSRNTEGNGLGLSIARSLTELQNGTMDITIDGDLFKVTLRFPIGE